MNRWPPTIDVEPLEPAQTKQITLRFGEGGARSLSIRPGTTAGEIKREQGLGKEYIITMGRGAEPFAEEEEVYSKVPNGAQLIAVTRADVGSIFDLFRRPFGGSADLQSDPTIQSLLNESADTSNKVQTCSSPPIIAQGWEERPYWQDRGWRKAGGRLEGYYKTKYGSYPGKATRSFSGRLTLYIKNPPVDVMQGSDHWACFSRKSGGWYHIHTTQISDLSGGIIKIEEIINESYAQRYEGNHF